MHNELYLELQNQRKTQASEVRDKWSKFISVLVEEDAAAYEDAKAFLRTTERRIEVNNELKVLLKFEHKGFVITRIHFLTLCLSKMLQMN